MHPHAIIIGIVGLALLFDFLNGMHDAANSIATVVSTPVLSPRRAVVWAAFFNFVAAFFFGVHAGRDRQRVCSSIIDNAVIVGVSGKPWDWITIVYGIP